MRTKRKATLLSFLFGAFGVHRFYLGQKFKGAFYLFFGVTSFSSVANGSRGFFAFMMVIGVIDAILILAKSQASFDREFNNGKTSNNEPRRHRRKDRRQQRTTVRKQRVNPTKPIQRTKESGQRIKAKTYIKEGIALFKSYDYVDAIETFNKALEIDPQNPNVHFNLACAYSLVEASDKAYMHLDKAMSLGFKQTEKIQTHDALAFIRTKDRFEDFKDNGYRIHKQLSAPNSVLEDLNHKSDTSELLEQLQALAKQRRQGDLSQEEFLEKKRLLVKK